VERRHEVGHGPRASSSSLVVYSTSPALRTPVVILVERWVFLDELAPMSDRERQLAIVR
jgi:hypothetical protein